MGRLTCQIAQFKRVVFQIHEDRRIGIAQRQLETTVPDGDQRRDRTLGGIFHRHGPALA
ncbi:hypothetical protein D3C72_2580630 [compost metagenome]